jgi:hypothetical protein
MNYAFAVLLALAVCATPVWGQEASSASEDNWFTAVGRIGDPGYRSFFMFSTKSGGYTVRADGYAENNSGKGRPQNFSLPLGRNGHMVRFYFLEYQNDLFLLYEVNDERLGWGYLVRLNQKSLKLKWSKPINGYNIGPGLIDTASDLYVSAANLFARIDLKTGQSIWETDDPQKQYPLMFDGFRLPQLVDDRVIFSEDRPKGKTVDIKKSSGRIIAVRE